MSHIINPITPKPPGGTVGTNRDDVLDGTRGNDEIWGLDGVDWIHGYGGVDWLHGGDGPDRIWGGDNNDHLYGDDGPDVLYGEADNDWLHGGAGYDVLYGGPGNDHLYAGPGPGPGFHYGINDDLLNGGAGADVFHGSASAKDCVDYSDSPGGVTVDLGGTGSGSDAQGDIYYDIENIQGSAFDDTMIGTDVGNTIWGGQGQDLLYGLGSDDHLDGGEGADVLDGGDGVDSAVYLSSLAGVTVDLAANTAAGGEAQGDTFIAIENVTGSIYDDTITGDAGANSLDGRSGNDTLIGGGGVDRLVGGGGQDTLIGGGEADSFVFFGINTVGDAPDTILDFSQTDGDVIDLEQFEGYSGPESFTFVGQADFTGEAWQLRYAQAGGETIVSGDIDGDGTADFEIHCLGTIDFTAGDFLL